MSNEDVRKGRRPLIAVGLAAVLGGGAYAVVTLGRDDSPVAESPASRVGSPASRAQSPASRVESPSSRGASPASTRARPPKALPPSVQARVDQARAAGSRVGHPVQRPPAPAAPEAAPVHERMENTAEGKLKVVSARSDLTGRREHLLAADEGTPVGDARCTHRMRFSAGAKPREIPNLVLCWRTSASRSVVTMASAAHGKLSAAASVAAIDQEWAKLG